MLCFLVLPALSYSMWVWPDVCTLRYETYNEIKSLQILICHVTLTYANLVEHIVLLIITFSVIMSQLCVSLSFELKLLVGSCLSSKELNHTHSS